MAPRPLPLWLASLLIQVGSFLLVLGLGIVAVSVVYGVRSVVLGTAVAATGYAAVGFPGWYVARLPHHLVTIRRLHARLVGRP